VTRSAIVDYDLCNLDSITRAVDECGGRPFVTDDPRRLNDATHIILPGVGAFPDAMANLGNSGMADALAEAVVGQGLPFLGICLGMHLMASKSFEVCETEGLGWVDGDIVRLVPAHPGERVPHVGWNEIEPLGGSPLFAGIDSGTDFYFVHSYHLACRSPDQIVGRTPYCGGFVSAVQRDNVMGVQFHPEKSQKMGFRLLRNFLSL
jgi:glutamine amidotransferase